MILVLLLVHAFGAVCLQRVAETSGAPGRWWAWVPGLNLLLPFRIAGRSLGWGLLLLVPGLNVVVWALAWADVCERLGRRPSLALGMAVPGLNLYLLGRLAGLSAPRLGAALALVAGASAFAFRYEATPARHAAPPARDAAALLNAARGSGGALLPDPLLVDALARPGASAVPLLVTGLRDSDAGVRWHAAAALLQLGQKASDATSALLTAMDDPEWVVRNAAGRALEEVVTAEAVDALAAALRAGGVETRYHVARAVGRLGADAAGAVPDLARALADEDFEVRMEAAWALSVAGPRAREALEALVGALSDPKPEVRGAASWTLGQLGAAARPAVAALRERLRDENPDVSAAASAALARIEASPR